MTEQQANQPESQTSTDIETKDDISADGNLEADDEFQSIGFLAQRILSRASQARKRTEGADAAAPSVSFAQTKPLGREAWGSLASNEKRGDGAVRVVTVLADLPIASQQPSITQTKDTTTKYRAYKRSANR